MSGQAPASERRRSVRLRPLLEFPIGVSIVREAGSEQSVEVADVSVGGLAIFASAALDHLAVESRHTLRIKLPGKAPIDAVAEVRHRRGDLTGSIGMMLVDPPSSTTSALGRYVAELLERGALS